MEEARAEEVVDTGENPGGEKLIEECNSKEEKKSAKQEKKSGKEKKKSDRARHRCPFPSCTAVVCHLPRHMRQRHKWSANDASGVLNAFGLRKDKKQTSKKGKAKREFKSMICPVLECQSVVKRLHNHLTDFHEMKRGSEIYRSSLASAVRHEVVVISSSESAGESSSSEEQAKVPCKKKMKQKKKHESIFKKVYPTSDEDSSEDDCPDYPEIFQSKEEQVAQLAEKNDFPSTSSHSCPDQGTTATGNQEGFDIDATSDDESDTRMELDKDCSDVPKTRPPQHEALFTKFEEWLQGPDGGRKDKRCAVQCSRQVQLVIEYIDKEQPKLSNILHKQILRDKWLSKFEKEKRPGTVKSYLGALNQFYIFLECESPPQINVPPEVLSCLRAQIKVWNKSHHKLIKDRFWEKRLDDLANLKTPEQVKAFDASDVARAAVKALGDFQDLPSGTIPSQCNYTVVRDYLLTLLCINNGSRSGALANMTLGEFRKAHEEDGCLVVKVKNHKTFTTHGPAHLILSSSLHQWMEIFISKFRNSIANGNNDDAAKVFLTWSNQPMQSSQIGCQIGSCWGKVFGKEAGAGGATAFRKAAVSAVHQSDEGQRENLAGLMVHNRSTADRYYLMQAKAKSAVQTSKYLTKIMHVEQSCPKEDVSGTIPSTSKEVGSGKIPSTSKEVDCISPRRRKWLLEEEAAIKDLFATNISNKSITMEDVREIANGHPLLCEISPSKVRDKIRSFFKNVESVLPSLPNESPQQRLNRIGIQTSVTTNQKKSDDGSEYSPSVVSPSTCVSKKSFQKLFKDDEYDVFKDTFKDLIETNKSITRDYVKQKIEADPKLCHLLNNYTLLQLADKVRTERRILARNSK